MARDEINAVEHRLVVTGIGDVRLTLSDLHLTLVKGTQIEQLKVSATPCGLSALVYTSDRLVELHTIIESQQENTKGAHT